MNDDIANIISVLGRKKPGQIFNQDIDDADADDDDNADDDNDDGT